MLMAGKQVLVSDIQDSAGRIALSLKLAFQEAVDVNAFLIAHTDAELVALGLSQEDVTLLKSAFADLAYMKGAAFDSSPFVKRIWGLGI